MKIRTRFAPSPTGRMHVGNLRTALYAYLIAKHEDGDFLLRIEDTDQEREMEGGDFILRIEDTDRERYVDGAVDIIYRTLEATGLKHDEGPDKDKGFGPYVQSGRVKSGLYMDYAKKLIEQGDAYYCFCDEERLKSLKTSVDSEDKTISKYDKHCLHLPKEEIQANLDSGMPYVIRLNVPEEGETSFDDEIYGHISVPNNELDDMILIKSDGYPTYNFANVIDDHLMGITHVVRGNEYLSSSPKYNRIYNAFGWDIPTYVHCPLITNEEHQKLSKRSGHSSFEDLTEQGFLPEAIVNYVALLGWSPEGNEEIFSLKELIEAFDYRRVNKSPAVFDMVKLRWMNGEYIKNMKFDAYKEYALPYVLESFYSQSCDPDDENNCAVITSDGARLDEDKIDKILELVKTRIEIFPDIPDLIDFFDELPEYDVSMYTHKKMKTNSQNSLETLKEVLPLLKEQADYSVQGLHDMIMRFIENKGVKNGIVLWPLRTAVSGKQSTPGGAFEIMEILGKEESLRRISVGIEKLEAVSGE